MSLHADREVARGSTMAVVECHLPYVRRYARLCTASRREADDLVKATLIAVARNPTCLNRGRVRVSLLALLLRIAQSFEAMQPVSTRIAANSADADPLASKLTTLPWQERHALLLVVVEEFTDEGAAELLDIEVAELRRCLAAARLGLV